MVEEKLEEKRERLASPRTRITIVVWVFVVSLYFYFNYYWFALGFGQVAEGAKSSDFSVLAVYWSLFWAFVTGVVGLIVSSIRRYANRWGFAFWCFTLALITHLIASALSVILFLSYR